MSKEITKNTTSNEIKLISTTLASCFNTFMSYCGVSMNNRTNIVNNLYFTREPSNIKKDESSTVVDKSATTEVIPNDEAIITVIWKYLNIDDKLNCTMVCKRFNHIISEMDYFCLVVEFTSMVHIIPRLSRSYKKVIIRRYQCNSLTSYMGEMLKHLGQSVIDLTLDGCEFNVIALCEFLRELSLLESLQLNLALTLEKNVHLSLENVPNLLQLKDFKIKVNADKLYEILDITGSASNVQSLSLFDAIFDINLCNYFRRYKSLTSLSLTKCIMDTTSNMSNLKTLQFDSSAKLPSGNYESFNFLEKVRKLELIEVNDNMLKIIFTKCVERLTDFKIIYNDGQKTDVILFFDYFIYINELYESKQRSENVDKSIIDRFRMPSIKTTYHNGKESSGNKFYHRKLVEGDKKVEYNFTENGKTEKSLKFSFKMSTITSYDSTIEGSKLEYYVKIFGLPYLCHIHLENRYTEKCNESQYCVVRNMKNPTEEKLHEIIEDYLNMTEYMRHNSNTLFNS